MTKADISLAWYLVLMATLPGHADDVQWSIPFADNPRLPTSFKQFELLRSDGSTQIAFLGHLKESPNRKRPLLVFFDGSGANSHFIAVGDKVGTSLFGLMSMLACEQYHVVACEKRGVTFLESGRGSAEGASREYQQHATFDGRVSEGVRLIDELLKQPTIDTSRIVVVGHSEGADVAAGVAAAHPRVTHAAFLAGGGPTQFFDLMILRRKAMQRENVADAIIEGEMDKLTDQFRAIIADPENIEITFMGHAYRRWATFCTNPPLQSLKQTRARLFLAQGSADESVPVESFDLLIAELVAAGKTNVTIRRYPGCDHGFMEKDAKPDQPAMEGLCREILTWASE